MTDETQTRRAYRRRTVLRVSGATLTAIGGGSLAATTGSATDDDTAPGQGIFGPGFEPEPDLTVALQGFFARYRGGYGPPTSVETLAERARNEFAANERLWTDYGNWVLDEHDVSSLGETTIGVTFALTRSGWPTRDESIDTTIDVAVEDDRVTGVDWRPDDPDDPDYEITIGNDAARYAYDELRQFRERFIDADGDDHQLPDDEYLNRLAGRYWDFVSFGPDSKSVLELLLGEVDA